MALERVNLRLELYRNMLEEVEMVFDWFKEVIN